MSGPPHIALAPTLHPLPVCHAALGKASWDNCRMRAAVHLAFSTLILLSAAALFAQAPPQRQQPQFIKQGQQLMREGNLEGALALYRQTLESSPVSVPANIAAGDVLDLMGKGQGAQILSKSHRRCREARAKNPPPSGPWPCLTLLKGTARKPSNSSRKSSISPCGICSSKEKLPTKPLGFASTPATWIRPSIGTRLVTTRD